MKKNYRSNSYGSKKIEYNGIWFASKLEKAVYEILWLRQEAGEIKDLRCQHTITLQEGPQRERIQIRIDFSYWEIKEDREEYWEAKGFPSDVWNLKLKLWRKNPPGYLEVWGGSWQRPKLIEIVEPIEGE